MRYTPFGVSRDAGTNLRTDHRFTSQIEDASIGIYWYTSRAYDPAIGRFVAPDGILPDVLNPQALNRYSYVHNNPLRYTDSTGHAIEDWFNESWKAEFRAAHDGADPTVFDYAWRAGSMAVASGMAKLEDLNDRFMADTMATARKGLYEGGFIDAEGNFTDKFQQVGALQAMEDESRVQDLQRAAAVAGAAEAYLRTERAARREAFRRNNIPTSQANNFERQPQEDASSAMRGPNGEPPEYVVVTDHNGRPIKSIPHHRWGHRFLNKYEPPHYHGPHGEHIFYEP